MAVEADTPELCPFAGSPEKSAYLLFLLKVKQVGWPAAKPVPHGSRKETALGVLGTKAKMGFMLPVLIHMLESKLHSGPHVGGLLLSKDGHTSHPDGTF